jgi:hypothetical protein
MGRSPNLRERRRGREPQEGRCRGESRGFRPRVEQDSGGPTRRRCVVRSRATEGRCGRSPWEEESAAAFSPAHRSQYPGEASSPGEQRPRVRVTPCPRVSDSDEVPDPVVGSRQRELPRPTTRGLRASRDATASFGGKSSEGLNPMSAIGMKQGRRAVQGASRREGENPCGRRRSRVRQARCRWTCTAWCAEGAPNLEGGSA